MKRRLTTLPGLVLLSVLGSSHAVASARSTAPSAGIEPWMVGYWKVSKNEDQSESGGGTASYTYDPHYRLTAVNDAAGHAVEAYAYNQTGNRRSKAAPGAYTGIYKYKAGTLWLTNMGRLPAHMTPMATRQATRRRAQCGAKDTTVENRMTAVI
ncbi:YD repeat-containing protein [Luteibacter sp. W1I16]|uniref:hypothetical protein n=1 Tax=Luteibacter sp. W1I16 TaxID=3373922 RepID=UPI003D20D8F9